jgi:hydrogenase maturation protease
VQLGRGSRVRLQPRASADPFDLTLAGRIAVVAGIEQDHDDRVQVAVTLEDSQGRSLGGGAQLGHRFFFSPEELEPLPAVPRILVAGIGNIFLADDGFGVAVAQRLLARAQPAGVAGVDVGIRGLDLAYTLQEGWDAVILIDAAPRGEVPGTLSVVEPALDAADGRAPDAHAMDPVHVLRLAARLGTVPARVRLIACEPATVTPVSETQIAAELSERVRAAIEPAVALVERLVRELQDEPTTLAEEAHP